LRLDTSAVAAGRSRAGAGSARRPAGIADANPPAGNGGADRFLVDGFRPVLRLVPAMTVRHPERLRPADRLRNSREFGAVQTGGTLFRGRASLLLVLPKPGEPTRVGFVASKRGVGGAVQRNRARRRLREIVRRRWTRVAAHGYWMVFIASRGALDAPHERLVADVESLLSSAGILAPAGER